MSYSDKFGSRLGEPFLPEQETRALLAVGGVLLPSWREALDEVVNELALGNIDWSEASLLSRLIRDGSIALALYSLRHHTLKRAA